MNPHEYEVFDELTTEHGVLYAEDEEAKTLRVESVGDAELSKFVPFIKQYADKKGLKKLSVKVSDSQALYFFQHGFQVEASILAYYGMQDAIFVVCYMDDELPDTNTEQHTILEQALSGHAARADTHQVQNVTISNAGMAAKVKIEDADKLVYPGREVLTGSNSLESTKFFAQIGNKTVATAHAQFNKTDKAVEFSDFTVNTEYDANVLIAALLADMEAFYLSKKCLTAFTIVSANSLEINTICAENHYEFGGTLKNESVIENSLVSLNTWFKRL